MAGIMSSMTESNPTPPRAPTWRGFSISVLVAIVGTAVFSILQSRMILVMESLPGIFLLVMGVKIAMQDVPPLLKRQQLALRTAVVVVAVGVSAWLSFPRAPSRVLKWQAYTTEDLSAALASGRPTVLDFYADWCPPCRAMDRQVFSRDEIADAMSAFNLIRVDATDQSDPLGIEASQRFSIYGLPTMVFFDANGEEVRGLRLLGPETPGRFLNRLDAVQGVK